MSAITHLFAGVPVTDLEGGPRRTRYVADLERVVDELSSGGVRFERYEDPALKADQKGIHELGDGRVAWFEDPDGNTFAVEQG